MFRNFHDKSEPLYRLLMEKRTHDDFALEESVVALLGDHMPAELIRIALKASSDPMGQLYDLHRARRLLEAGSDGGGFRVRDEVVYGNYVQQRWWQRWFRPDWEAAHRLMEKNGHIRTVVHA